MCTMFQSPQTFRWPWFMNHPSVHMQATSSTSIHKDSSCITPPVLQCKYNNPYPGYSKTWITRPVLYMQATMQSILTCTKITQPSSITIHDDTTHTDMHKDCTAFQYNNIMATKPILACTKMNQPSINQQITIQRVLTYAYTKTWITPPI